MKLKMIKKMKIININIIFYFRKIFNLFKTTH